MTDQIVRPLLAADAEQNLDLPTLNMTIGHFRNQLAVRALDQLVHASHAIARELAAKVPSISPSPLQRAALSLVPQSIHLAASIRFLVDGAMIFSAAVLLRPLVERVGTFTYLARNPFRAGDWARNWKNCKKPTLSALLSTLEDGLNELGRTDIVQELHKLVHATAESEWASCVEGSNGGIALAAHQMPRSVDTARYVSFFGGMALLSLLVVIQRVFPSVLDKRFIDKQLSLGIGTLVQASLEALANEEDIDELKKLLSGNPSAPSET